MKICAAQIRPVKGDIEKNVENHKKLIELAASNGANILVFPELSLTSYESILAEDLAVVPDDERFDVFQKISDASEIVIGVGVPTKSETGVLISMLIFQPHQPRQIYSKQQLHSDEMPYFVGGKDEIFLEIGNEKIAPAICYESLLPEHAEKAVASGANFYLTSVAKSSGGVEKGYKHYPEIAKKYSMTVLMANSLGPCDDFESVGKSAIWNDEGELVGNLNDASEGILIFDTETQKIDVQQFEINKF